MGLFGSPNIEKLKTRKNVKGLIKALKDNNRDIRRYAAKAFWKIKDARAVEPLIEALKDEDYDVRRRAAEALGKIGDARAVEPLIEALKDEDSVVRSSAVEALGKIGDRRAVEPLIEALKDEDSVVRSSAKEALALVNLGGLSSGNHKQCLLFEIVHEGASDISQEDKYPAWYSSNYTRTTKWAKIRRSFSWSIIRPEIGEETFSRKCLCCEQILKINVPSLALIASRERKSRNVNRILRIIGLVFLLFAVSAFLTLGFGWLPSSWKQVLIYCGAFGTIVSLGLFGAGSGVNVPGHQLIYGLSNPPRSPGPFNGHYIELFKELP